MLEAPEFGPLPEAPKRSYSNHKHEAAATALQAAAGQWAKVNTYKSEKTAAAAAYRLKSGKVKSFQAPADGSGTYEAVARGTDMWVRFVTPASSAEEAAMSVPAHAAAE